MESQNPQAFFLSLLPHIFSLVIFNCLWICYWPLGCLINTWYLELLLQPLILVFVDNSLVLLKASIAATFLLDSQ